MCALAPTTQAEAGRYNEAPPVPFCALDGGLKVRMLPGGAAAGTAYERIVLVNAGATKCVLQGIPGAQPATGVVPHQPVGPSSARNLPQPGRGGTLILRPRGGRADVIYGVETAVNWPKAKCEAKWSRGVLLHFAGVRAFYVADLSAGYGPSKGSWLVCTRRRSTLIYGVKAGQGGPP
jgi:Protein of unknown function (DUF4232)